ncbi:unnamed protein product, partial [Symbiodinium sp. KB8]
VGGKDLQASGIYPGTFAMKVADLLKDHLAKSWPNINEMEMVIDDSSDTRDADSDSGLENLVGVQAAIDRRRSSA